MPSPGPMNKIRKKGTYTFGAIYGENGRYDDAIEAFYQGIDLNPLDTNMNSSHNISWHDRTSVHIIS